MITRYELGTLNVNIESEGITQIKGDEIKVTVKFREPIITLDLYQIPIVKFDR
jgi:hypothetical protein